MARRLQAPALLVFSLLAAPAHGIGQDPALCADQIVGAIDGICDGANNAAQAAVDCTIPTLDEASCAIDISNFIKEMAGLASKISMMTLSCGDLDNTCAATISSVVNGVADLSGNLIAAAGDCLSDPFLCTYDVMASVEVLNGMIDNIIGALVSCNGGVWIPLGNELFRRLSGTSETLGKISSELKAQAVKPAYVPAEVGAQFAEAVADLRKQVEDMKAAQGLSNKETALLV